MNPNICISAETPEELEEIKTILSDAGKKYITYEPKNRNKIYDSIHFLIYLKRRKIKTIIGAPCLRNRVARLFGITYISYLRSLHPSPEAASSLSDRIYFKLKSLGIKKNIFNPYSANICLVTANVTESFLIAREIEKFRIFNIGACWLKKEKLPPIEATDISLCFITQAFSEHLNEKAHQEQVNAIERFSRLAYEKGTTLTIRKHPRDFYNYLAHFHNKEHNTKIKINTDTPINFLTNFNQNNIIISSFSTLAFELLQSGAKAIFISLESAPSFYDSFRKIGITPLRWENAKIEDARIIEAIVFNKYDADNIKELFKNKLKDA